MENAVVLYHYERKQGTTTLCAAVAIRVKLYHYERKQGTTTARFHCGRYHALYHYERKQGTTTGILPRRPCISLYHYERKQGTTTAIHGMIEATKLYHYERKQGTTTLPPLHAGAKGLYHYERKLGTTTSTTSRPSLSALYHYERKLGTTTMRPHWGNKFPSYCNSCGGGELRTRGAHRAQKKKTPAQFWTWRKISPQVTPKAPQRADVSFHNILSQESGVKASGGSHCRFDIFPAIFFLLLVEMAFYGIINLWSYRYGSSFAALSKGVTGWRRMELNQRSSGRFPLWQKNTSYKKWFFLAPEHERTSTAQAILIWLFMAAIYAASGWMLRRKHIRCWPLSLSSAVSLKRWRKASVSDMPIFWIRSEKLFYKHMEAHNGTWK